ncbi:MAG: AI-2E family transporter [Phycisphaerales bacterium]|nr:AI-2E family transporter [Phycisphaerales bacterium]
MAEPSDKQQPGADWRTVHLWQIQPLRDLLVLAVVVFIILLGYWLSPITVPLLIALALAYLTEPIIELATRRWNWSRQRCILILLGVTVLIAGAAILIVVPLVVGQAIRLIDHAPQYIERVSTSLQETGIGEETASLQRILDRAQEWLQGNAGSIAAPAFATSGDAIRFVGGVVASTVYFLFMLFLIPFYYYFFAAWYESITKFGRSLIPEAKCETVLPLIAKMDQAVSGFVRGRLVICALMGLMFAVGWWICGVPYWLLLGLLTGVFSLVPYLGSVGVPLAVGMLWFKLAGDAEDGVNYWLLIWPVVVFAIVQFVEGYVLIPLIQGKATNLDPVTLLVAVLAGGTIMGVYGMLLAIPIAACGKILLTDVVWPRVRDWSQGRADDPLPISRE